MLDQASAATVPAVHVPHVDECPIEETELATLDRIQEMIRAVDAKVPVLMGIQTAMLGGLAACLPDRKDLAVAHLVWLAIGAVPAAVGVVLGALATLPRTRALNNSLLFFGTIAARSAEQHAAAVRSR